MRSLLCFQSGFARHPLLRELLARAELGLKVSLKPVDMPLGEAIALWDFCIRWQRAIVADDQEGNSRLTLEAPLRKNSPTIAFRAIYCICALG